MNSKTFKTKEFFTYLVPIILIDLIVQIAAFRLCSWKFHYWDPADLVMRKQKVVYFLIVGYAFASIIVPPKLYERGVKIRDIALGAFLQTLFTLGICAVSVDSLFNSFAGKLYLPDGIIATLSVFFVNLMLKMLVDFVRKHGRNKIHTLIVGTDANSLKLYRNLSAENQYDYKMLGVFTDDAAPQDVHVLGSIADLGDYLANNKVHNLYCGISPAIHTDQVNGIIRLCENLFVEFYYIPDMTGYMSRSMNFESVAGSTVMSLREEPLSYPLNRFVKRSFDIVLSGLFLVTVFPIVWVFVAIGTTLSSPGPIFFRQKRTGYRGKPFTMLKFRSMKVNKDADRLQATKNDPRKTKFGDFLRRSSIDELPQMINVFRGDMSLIGPRPHMEMHTQMYNELIDKYMVRHMAKPGLTGWAQVNGYRGETKTLDQMEGRVRCDIWYIENWSIFIDIKIFFMTIVQILGGDKQAY